MEAHQLESRLMIERGLSMERLFTFTYLTERTALDELALDDGIGATSEPGSRVVTGSGRRGTGVSATLPNAESTQTTPPARATSNR